MASFTTDKVVNFSIVFDILTHQHGKERVTKEKLAWFLEQIGYCATNLDALADATAFIRACDFDCQGSLCFEDFLIVMYKIEEEKNLLRTHVYDTLEYFCSRKIQQNSSKTFGLQDVESFLGRISIMDGQRMMDDFEQEILQHFGVNTQNLASRFPTNTDLSNKKSIVSDRRVSALQLSSGPRGTSDIEGQRASLPATSVSILNDSLIAIPEATLIEAIVTKMFPHDGLPVFPKEFQGHQCQQVNFGALSVHNLDYYRKSKLRNKTETSLQLSTIDPIFVVECGDAIFQTKPLGGFDFCEQLTEEITLEITLPSLTAVDVVMWLDEIDVHISIFDFQDSGVVPWMEWVGSTRQRLSWFLDQASGGAGKAYSLELANISPTTENSPPVRVEFVLNLSQDLTDVWHRYRTRCSLPEHRVTYSTIRASLNSEEAQLICDKQAESKIDSRKLSESSASTDVPAEIWFEYWKAKQEECIHWFPRRRTEVLAQSEQGRYHILPRFVQILPDIGINDPVLIAETFACLESGNIPYCDTARSAFHCETIASPSLSLFNKSGTPMEIAILLCGAFLGLHMESYICLTESEIPWVLTIERKNEQEIGVTEETKTEISFLREEEKMSCAIDRSRVALKFWDPTTGDCKLEGDPGAPVVINSLFNNENYWKNVQSSNAISRTKFSTIVGEFEDKMCWLPFISKKITQKLLLKEIPRIYSSPDFTSYQHLGTRKPAVESKILLSDLVDAISLFRQHKLFLPDTVYHRGMSQVLQNELEIARKGPSHPKSVSSLALPGGMTKNVLDNLPWGTIFSGSIYILKTTNVQEIMVKLEETGIISNTIPGIQYCVAAQVFPMNFGLSVTYVYIGTLQEVVA